MVIWCRGVIGVPYIPEVAEDLPEVAYVTCATYKVGDSLVPRLE
jgi:hypothetical protein